MVWWRRKDQYHVIMRIVSCYNTCGKWIGAWLPVFTRFAWVEVWRRSTVIEHHHTKDFKMHRAVYRRSESNPQEAVSFIDLML